MKLNIVNLRKTPRIFWAALLFLVTPIYTALTVIFGTEQNFYAWIEPVILLLVAGMLIFKIPKERLKIPFGLMAVIYGALFLYGAFMMVHIYRSGQLDFKQAKHTISFIVAISQAVEWGLKFATSAMLMAFFSGKTTEADRKYWFVPFFMWLSAAVITAIIWSVQIGIADSGKMVLSIALKSGGTAAAIFLMSRELIKEG